MHNDFYAHLRDILYNIYCIIIFDIVITNNIYVGKSYYKSTETFVALG